MTILERLRAATGPDRELDALIWLETTDGATRRESTVTSSTNLWPPYTIDETRDATGRLITVPSYTASIDAALALVERMLPGAAYDMHKSDKGYSFSILRAYLDRPYFGGATPALAILTALFAALEAKERT
jgi:hypothetical protein